MVIAVFAQNEIRACRRMVAQFLWAAAVGSGLLLTTIAEPAAETKVVGPDSLRNLRPSWPKAPPGVDLWCYPDGWRPPDDGWLVANMTSYVIKAGTILYFKTCDQSGCRTWTYVVDKDWPPNTALVVKDGRRGASSGTPGATCTATMMPPLRQPDKITVPEYSRTRPPGPPQPGLLEDGTGLTRQSPSSVGTPKPGATPPYTPYGTKTLR